MTILDSAFVGFVIKESSAECWYLTELFRAHCLGDESESGFRKNREGVGYSRWFASSRTGVSIDLRYLKTVEAMSQL